MDPVLIRSTEPAEAWLSQFDPDDRDTASLLLESLQLVSHSEFQNGLTELLSETRAQSPRPVAAFAIREPDDIELPPPQRVANTEAPPGIWHYFEEVDKTNRPNAVGQGAGVGSEGTVATLVRDMTIQEGSSAFLDHPSIDSMCCVKARRAFLVDDVIGSGTRASNFVDAFVNHKTIKSWHSRGYLTITVIAYAGTEQGIQRVRSHHYVKDVVCAHTISQADLLWSDTDGYNVVELCRKYALRTRAPKIPFGYGDAFSLIVFEHGCPNTAPPILWLDSKQPEWHAMFKQRPGTGFTVWPIPLDPKERAERLLRQMGQAKLVGTAWMHHVQPLGRQRLLLLAAVAKRLRKTCILASIVGLSEHQVLRLLLDCVRSDWMTWDHRITPRGLQELESARRVGLLDREDVELRDEFYFPRALRAARDSV